MKLFRSLVLVVLLSAIAASGAFATDYFVAKTGLDTNPGTITQPFLTITKGVSVAMPGDTVQVRTGNYAEDRLDFVRDGTSGALITVRSYDGDRAAHVTDSVWVHARKYIKLEGMQISGGTNSLHIDPGTDMIPRSEYITVLRCYIHGTSGGDNFKINQSDYVTLEDCEIQGPAGDETVDLVWANYCSMVRAYIHDFTAYGFSQKGGSRYNVLDSCVLSHAMTDTTRATRFGGSTDTQYRDPTTDYASEYGVYRNNVFRDTVSEAVGTYGCWYAYLYNNTIHNCGSPSDAVFNHHSDPKYSGDGGSRHLFYYNNIIMDTNGDMPQVFYDQSGYPYEDWQHNYNCYWNNGNPIPTGSWVGFDPNLEPNSTFGNPNLANPTGTGTTREGWAALYRITSASTVLIDRGYSGAGADPRPAVHYDIEGVARPQGAGWDIGASEYPSGPVPPTANFTGNPTGGAVPLTVAFTDTSTGSPTSWSWTFGDGGTSTAQSPSHIYNSTGQFTVSLTATNAYGSDGETKSNYITVNTPTPPTFVAAGAVVSGTGAVTPALPAGIAANDILLLFVETANQASSISNQNGGTWAEVTGSPQGYGTAVASDAVRLTVFWSRYNGTQGAPTVSDSGDHQQGRIVAIRGAATSGNPWDVTAGGTESTVDTSGAIPGATTTVANTLVVTAIATSLPDASSTANFSAWANANLTSVTERTDNASKAGNGGGLAVATGEKATAGAYGSTAVTCGTATTKAMLSVALKP